VCDIQLTMKVDLSLLSGLQPVFMII